MSRNEYSMNLFFFMSCFFLFSTIAASGAEGSSKAGPSQVQSVYVPAYSHVYSGDREHPVYLAVTLSIRNADPHNPITIISVDYNDSEGRLLKRYLEAPIHLKPLASTYYIVKESDRSGGSGASFIVRWKSDHRVRAPIVETVMIGTRSQQGISFTSRGEPIPNPSR